MKDIELKTSEVILKELKNKKFVLNDLKNKIISEINEYVIEKTGRKPIIMPVIMEIKNEDE